MNSRTKRKPVRGIGGDIQRHREQHGLGLAELAKRAGISKGLLSRIESTPNRDIKLSTFCIIARGLELTPLGLMLLCGKSTLAPKPKSAQTRKV